MTEQHPELRLSATASARRTTRYVAGFIVLYVLGVTALRSQFGLRYDDTTVYESVHGGDRTLQNVDWRKIWVPSLRGPGAQYGNYRPLAFTYGIAAFRAADRVGLPPVYFLCFFLLGLSAYVIFRLIATCSDDKIAVLATLAYLFFPPVVSASWIPLAAPQSLIPCGFALSLLCYKRFLDSSKKRWLVPVFFVAALGSYFKEALATVPILVLIHYLLFVPRRSAILVISLLAVTVLGIFPVMLPTLLVTGRPSTLSIFQMGALHENLNGATLRTEFLLDLVAFVPPIYRIPFLACAGAIAITQPAAYVPRLPEWIHRPAFRVIRGATAALAAAGIVATAAEMLGSGAKSGVYSSACFLAVAATYSLLYVHPLISGWLAAMLLGIARIYFNVTQCGYVAAPLLCTLIHGGCFAAALIARRSAERPLLPRLAVGIVLFCGGVAFLDNSLSLPNACFAFRGSQLYSSALTPGPIRSTLEDPECKAKFVHFSNTILTDDAVAFASDCRIVRGNYSFDFGAPPTRVIKEPAQLARITGEYDSALYVAEYVPAFKRQWVDLRGLRRQYRELGVVKVGWTAWFADPFRTLVKNRYSTMMGPPDFQDEFKKREHAFRVTYSNRIWVGFRPRGEVDTASVHFTNHDVKVELLVQGVGGYNLLQVGSQYVAFPQQMGAFDYGRFSAGEYSECPTAASLDDLKRMVRLKSSRPPTAEHFTVHLVQEGVAGCNILKVNRTYIAFPQSQGKFDVSNYHRGQYGRLIAGKSADAVRRAVANSTRDVERQ